MNLIEMNESFGNTIKQSRVICKYTHPANGFYGIKNIKIRVIILITCVQLHKNVLDVDRLSFTGLFKTKSAKTISQSKSRGLHCRLNKINLAGYYIRRLVHTPPIRLLPTDNELTDGCQLRSDVSAVAAYHTTLGTGYNLSTLSVIK